MTEAVRRNKILAVCVMAGLVCALILGGARMAIEAADTGVSVIMSTDDLAKLSAAPEGVRAFDGGESLDGAVLLVEDRDQFSYVPMYGAEYEPGNSVRCLYLYPEYAARYGALGYSGAEEIENLLYRAVTDRNIRVIWLTPFTDAGTGEVVTDAAVYEDVLVGLAPRLARQGLTLVGGFSLLPEYEPNAALSILTAFGAVCAGLLLLGAFFTVELRSWAKFVIPAAALILCAGAYLVLHSLFVPLFAFGASVVYPCLALWYMTTRLAELRHGALRHDVGAFLGILASGVGICLAGGLTVGALQSGTDYLLAVSNFRGVKLSQLVSLAFAVYAVLRFLCPPKEILSGKKFALILAALLLICGGGYYILRTGNAQVSVFEQRFRNALEQLLIARPRTKEFLVAWPCLAIAAMLIFKDKRRWSWPFAILTSTGFASCVNTFCHSRAPLWLSLARTLLGFLIGAAVGCVLIAATYRRKTE